MLRIFSSDANNTGKLIFSVSVNVWGMNLYVVISLRASHPVTESFFFSFYLGGEMDSGRTRKAYRRTQSESDDKADL